MRTIILILIVGVLIVIAAIATGFLNISQTRPAQAPEVSATHNGVVAKGGQAPAFAVETGSVKIGTQQTTVKVPGVVVEKPVQNQTAPATANAQ
jgi:hypothetical protein